MTKIGILEGSLRKASLSRLVGRSAAALVPEGVAITHLPSTETLPHYNQDIQDAGFPDSVTAMRDAVADIDALLIVTPEYNWSMPGTLKNAIDWLSRFNPNPLDGKPAAIWTVAPGLLGGARAHQDIRQVLHSQGMQVMAKPEVQVAGAKVKVDLDTDQISDEQVAQFLAAHLAKFGEFCQRFSA